MISYIYTGELAGGLQLLDIQVDMYDLPGWMELFPSHNSIAGAIQNLVL